MRTVIELDGGLRPESKVKINGVPMGAVVGVSNTGALMSLIVDDGIVAAPTKDTTDAQGTHPE